MDCDCVVDRYRTNCGIAYADWARGNAGGSCRRGVLLGITGGFVHHGTISGRGWRQHSARKQGSLIVTLDRGLACWKCERATHLTSSSELFAFPEDLDAPRVFVPCAVYASHSCRCTRAAHSPGRAPACGEAAAEDWCGIGG